MAKISTLDLVVVTPTESYLMAFGVDRSHSISIDLSRNAAGVLSALNRRPYAGGTRSAAFTADCRIGAACTSNKLVVWNLLTGRDLGSLDTGMSAKWIGLAPAANTVAAGNGGRLRAWNYAMAGKQTMDVKSPHGSFATVYYASSLKGHCIATAGSDRRLRIWDVTNGECIATWQLDAKPAGISMSADGRFVAAWGEDENKMSLYGVPNP